MSESIQYIFEDTRTVVLQIREDIYPLDAIYGASYLFIDRCFVFLDRPEDQVVSVRLRTKDQKQSDTGNEDLSVLEALVGEFANELLNQVLRFRITESTAKIENITWPKLLCLYLHKHHWMHCWQNWMQKSWKMMSWKSVFLGNKIQKHNSVIGKIDSLRATKTKNRM